MELKDNIKLYRQKSGLTLQELADKINISKSTLHKYESGKITNIPSDKITNMANIFNISPAELMGWTDVMGQIALVNILKDLYDGYIDHYDLGHREYYMTIISNDIKIILNREQQEQLYKFVKSNIENFINIINPKKILIDKNTKKIIVDNNNDYSNDELEVIDMCNELLPDRNLDIL